jgi:thiol-disulfide isomerase/thioredoxin
MKFLNKPVYYLQRSDFDNEGNITNPEIPVDKPIVIMIQAGFCHFCEIAKPAFQEFANSNADKYFIATIQPDGDVKGEREIEPILKKIDPEFMGYPSYVIHYKGKRFPHKGGRDVNSLIEFAKNTV